MPEKPFTKSIVPPSAPLFGNDEKKVDKKEDRVAKPTAPRPKEDHSKKKKSSL